MIKIISFLGPDGSGKSTLIKMLESDLRHNLFNLKIKVIHFNPNIKHKNIDEIVLPYNKKPHNYFLSIVKLFIWLLEYIFYFILIFLKNYSQKTIIIFDRHLLDIKFDPLRYKINLKASRLPFNKFIYPKPDIIFYIDAPAEIINKRKNEVSLVETQQQVKMYRDNIKNLKNVIIINNHQPIEISYKIIYKNILEKLKFENIANS